eukprot:g10286.t1
MRGFAPFLLLFAAGIDLITGHAVSIGRQDERRALSAVKETNQVDMFYRRLDPEPGQCCGMCTRLVLSSTIVVLLISGTDPTAGNLSPIVADPDVTIIIRITIIFTDNNAADTNMEQSLIFDVTVVPDDWNPEPCSYLEDDCVVFENDEIIMFAPDFVGGFATLSLEAVNEFTADTDINVISTACDLVQEGQPDVAFGEPDRSRFNAGFCDPSIWNDPHVSGLRGQRFDWSGEDGGWYAFLSTPDQLQMNLRVTSHLPETFPERQLVTGVALVTDGGHTITVDIEDPLDLAPTCRGTADTTTGSAPCLVNGGLRMIVDGHEEMRRAGEYHFDGDVDITAVNLPLECQRFGDYLMWGDLDEEQRLRSNSRGLRSAGGAVTSIFEWLLEDTVMIAPPWCVKFLDELSGDMEALAGIESNHAVLRIETPNLSVRVNVGINTEQEQTLQDGRVVPTASFWQMDVRVEHAEGIAAAKGMLGETARPVRDHQTGKKVMSGLGVLRGDVEDYRVIHPLGTEFAQMFGNGSGDPGIPTVMATMMHPDESSQDVLLPAAANGSSSSMDPAEKKGATTDASSSDKKPDSKAKPEPKPQVPLAKLFSHADKRDKMFMLLGTLAAALQACTMPIFMVNMGATLDGLGEPKDGEIKTAAESVKDFVVIFAVIGALAGLAGFAMVSLWSIAGECQALRIRRAYVRCILKQDIGWFDEHPTGQLPTTVTANMAKVQDGLGRKVGDIVFNGLSGVAVLITAAYLNWQLMLVMLGCIPFIGATVGILTQMMSSTTQEGNDHYSKAGGVATEVLSGIRTVASLNAEEIELKRYADHLDGAYAAGVKEGLSMGVGNGALFMAFYASYGLAFWFGTKQVADGTDKTGGVVLASIFSVLFGAMMLGQTAPGITAISVARGAAVEVFETLDRVPPIDSSSPEGLKPGGVDGQVVFHSVGFSYPARPDDVVYEKLSLAANTGKTLALVGPSGGGKSTITKLLLRFYDPTSGSITLDSVDIKTLNIAWYRQQIGYVGQEPVLFTGTIGLNIANGKQGATTHDEIIAAAKAANAHEFIKSFPDGYNTTVGEGGFQLSGGQKQRIAIARAIVKDPAILLLDEATSALDSESEKVVQAALDRLHKLKPRTTVTIAHRLSTIQNADKIAVIDKGVVEVGTHSELLALKGVYHTLCSSQGGTAGESNDDAKHAKEIGSSDAQEGRDVSVSDADPRRQNSVAGGVAINVSSNATKKDTAEKEEKLPKPPSSRLWGLNKGDWPWLLLGFVGAVVVGGCAPSEGVFLAQVQSNMYLPDKEEMRKIGNRWAMGFVALGLCTMLGNVALSLGFAVSGERMTRKLRNMAFRAMVRHDISWFDQEANAVGVLTARLESEASSAKKATGSNVAHGTQLTMTLAVGVLIGLGFAWQIGLLAIATIPFIAVAGIVQMAMLTGGYGDKDGLDGGGGAAGLLSSALQGMTTVTAFNMQEKLAEDYKKASEASLDARRKRGLIDGAAFGYSQGITFWIFALLFYVGAIMVDNGQVEYANFFTAMFAVMFGGFGVGQITGDTKDAGVGQQAAAKIFRLTDEPLNIDPLSEEGARPTETQGALGFKNIFFAYPSRPNMQIYGSDEYPQGFCLDVAAGETVALVGPSGGGKSTCMGLLLRFYEPANGSVTIDGRDIKEIGYVGQEPVLFQGTIRENIAKGDPSATNERIEEAAKAANAHNFIMAFAEGYETDVGEKSALLSGGQKQRIAIARAIVNNPPILLLDEATSALDNESEKVVQEALDQLQAQQKRTTLTVAHRLTTVRNSDKIAVLNGGGVQELGTHDELLALNGLYSKLWHQQTSKLGGGGGQS